MKKGTPAKIAAGGATAAGVYFGGGAIGEATGIAPGWKRGAIGVGVTVVLAGVASMLKATKKFTTAVAVGGVTGAIALMFEPQLKSFMAERKAAAPRMAPPPAPPPPPPPTPPSITYEAPERVPEWYEGLWGVVGEGLGVLGRGLGVPSGGGLTYDEPWGAGASLGIYEATRN